MGREPVRPRPGASATNRHTPGDSKQREFISRGPGGHESGISIPGSASRRQQSQTTSSGSGRASSGPRWPPASRGLWPLARVSASVFPWPSALCLISLCLSRLRTLVSELRVVTFAKTLLPNKVASPGPRGVDVHVSLAGQPSAPTPHSQLPPSGLPAIVSLPHP